MKLSLGSSIDLIIDNPSQPWKLKDSKKTPDPGETATNDTNASPRQNGTRENASISYSFREPSSSNVLNYGVFRKKL